MRVRVLRPDGTLSELVFDGEADRVCPSVLKTNIVRMNDEWNDMRARLVEAVKALQVADEALDFLARYYLPDGRDAREVVKAALVKAKEML